MEIGSREIPNPSVSHFQLFWILRVVIVDHSFPEMIKLFLLHSSNQKRFCHFWKALDQLPLEFSIFCLQKKFSKFTKFYKLCSLCSLLFFCSPAAPPLGATKEKKYWARFKFANVVSRYMFYNFSKSTLLFVQNTTRAWPEGGARVHTRAWYVSWHVFDT